MGDGVVRNLAVREAHRGDTGWQVVGANCKARTVNGVTVEVTFFPRVSNWMVAARDWRADSYELTLHPDEDTAMLVAEALLSLGG